MSQAAKDVKDTVQDLKNTAKDLAGDAKTAVDDVVSSAKSTAHKVADTTEDLADDIADKAKETVRSVRRTASEAIDSTGRHLRSADEQVNPLIDNLADRAQDLAERSINFWADSSHRARRQIHTATDATTKYVSEQPGKSVLIAAATGAALAAAFFLGRSRK